MCCIFQKTYVEYKKLKSIRQSGGQRRKEMDHQRPRGREKHVTGPEKSVNKLGEGLHTGPVGDADGYSDRNEPYSGSGKHS